MDDLLLEFLTETNENMAKLDIEIVRLEQNPNDRDLLSNIFRMVHTVKGTCGFLGLPRLEAVAHASENILGKYRDGALVVTQDSVSLILESLDTIKRLLGVLEKTEAEPEGDDSDLIARLNEAAEGKTPSRAAPAPVSSSPPAAAVAAPTLDELIDFTPVMAPGAVPLSAPAAAAPATASATAVPAPMPASLDLPQEIAQQMAPAKKKEVAPAANVPATANTPAAPHDGGAGGAGVSDQSIRVNVTLLENLMTMVSELVLTRNQLLQILRTQKESDFTTPLQRLNHITSELQDGVMKTRMQPIGNAWSKLPRLIRDLSLELNKKIDLQMLGAETELDRQVLELIKDPLTHMVRNSADHGLERPEDRVKAGKPETGKIVLNAYHEGGHIIIEIADDGRGLNIDRIKQKAIQNSLASEAELAAMSDQQIAMFIFRAGFSTAEKISNVSGRGVGMDVVKTNIEKIGGTVDLQTTPGRGTRFLVKIPLTLAIVSALIVECERERFAIPQICVIELVRASNRSEYKIEYIRNAPVLRLRNRLLPLVSLRQLLHLGKDDPAETRDTYIVVTKIGSATFGIMVDRVFDTEEIVVKPVAPILRNISMFSGNTILGDGSVIMILDPNGIANAAGDIHSNTEIEAKEAKRLRDDSTVALLLFRAGVGAPKAVPLSLVARLEDINLASVEKSQNLPVIQYRGRLMPLIPYAADFTFREEGQQPVLVFADGDRSMGLVVDEIVDIVDEKLSVELSVDKPGLMGSAIINGRATDVIDAGWYLTQAFKDWFGSQHVESFEEEAETRRLLLVDDSPFFRNLLTPLLNVAGYRVITCENPQQALRLCEEGEPFDIIVSDIEMPGMNGFDFAAAVRAGGAWRTVPMIALSSHATPRDLDRGRAAGFTDYVAKFDRDALLKTIAQTLSEGTGGAA